MRRRTPLVALLSAEVISMLGSRTSFFAVPWLVLVTTGSPRLMGLVSAAEMLPYVLTGLLAAPLTDRIGPRRMSILTDVVSAAAVAGVAVGHRAGLGVLFGLVAIVGAARGVGDRARAVLLRPTVEAAGVPIARATSVYDGIGRLAALIGAPLGGVLIAWIGAPGVLWLDAVSFAVGAVLVSTMVPAPPADAPGTEPERERYLAALRAGVVHLWRDRLLFGMVTMLLVTNLCNQAMAVVFIPLWVRDVLHTPAGLGLITGTFALGAVLGNLAFTALATRLPRYLTLAVGFVVGGAPRFVALALSDSLGVVLAVSFVTGVAIASVNPIIGVTLFQRIPPKLQARVFGLVAAFALGGLPLGAVLGGWMAQGFGLTLGLLVAGGLYFAASVTPFVNRRTWQALDDKPATPAGTPAAAEPSPDEDAQPVHGRSA